MTCYLDSSAFLALADRRDQHHEAMTEAYRQIVADGLRRVTSPPVLYETLTLLRFRVSHSVAARFLENLPGAGIAVIPVSERFESRAKTIFLKFNDHWFSFVDCASFAMIELERITHVLTLDSDFRAFPFRHAVRILP